jgi:hypothetical protein
MMIVQQAVGQPGAEDNRCLYITTHPYERIQKKKEKKEKKERKEEKEEKNTLNNTNCRISPNTEPKSTKYSSKSPQNDAESPGSLEKSSVF